jgi:glycine/D-amino acid oxidase-like deaminating enzyme
MRLIVVGAGVVGAACAYPASDLGATLGPLTGAVAARTALGAGQPVDLAPSDPLR